MAGARDDERQIARGGSELEHSLLLREPPHEEDVRRLLGRNDFGWDRDAGRHDAHVARSEGACVRRKGL